MQKILLVLLSIIFSISLFGQPLESPELNKEALIVGIDHYEGENIAPLYGCIKDATNVRDMLATNEDNSPNFDSRLYTDLTTSKLKDKIEDLFSKDLDIALFYFAGHGYVENTGFYLIASDSERGDDGVSFNQIFAYAKDSPAKNIIIILDSCHSGSAGEINILGDNLSVLPEGMTILTASAKNEYAMEGNDGGVFTNLLLDALNGSAANLLGDITPGSLYAHIDQSLGPWEQRPIFKANIKRFVSLRKAKPPISLENLKRIAEFFPNEGFEFKLDPTYEKEMKGRDEGMPKPIEAHTKIFAVLQKYNRLNLLVPVDAPHMWHAAMESKSCKLTALGEHYRRLVAKGRI